MGPWSADGWSALGRALVAGAAEGEALVLAEPLSLWGGLEPETGRVVDAHHPQAGAVVAGRVLVMSSGRGSSSSSTILAEAVRLDAAPVGIVLAEADEILAAGALVAEELYGRTCPVVVVSGIGRIYTGDRIRIEPDGRVTVLTRNATQLG